MSETPENADEKEVGGAPAAGNSASLKQHSWFRIWAEVAGAWSISLAYPLYTHIASGPEALTSYGLRRLDLVVLIIAVSLLGPLVIALCELAIRRLFGEPARRALHGVVIGGLLSLIFWRWMLEHGWPDAARNLLPLVLTGLIAWLYVKTELVRNFAEILGLATVVVVIVFLLDYPIRDEVLPHEPQAGVGKIDSETPVVVVVFDELPLAALEQPGGRIDPRFPTFSMLARRATWYPGAVSVADQTLHALPSILTGTDPAGGSATEPPAPGLANYPDSLCRIAAEGGYEVHSYEPITDLCERNWNLATRITATIRRALGADSPLSPVDLTPTDLDKKLARGLNKPFDQPYTEIDEGRREAFDEFIADLPAGKRSLSLLHSTLPHVHWMYLPDGRSYPNFRAYGESQLISPASQAEVDRDAQQMMLQLQFTDRELGKLVRKMKADGTWDEALFVVTADHGAAFQAGGSRRMLNVFNGSWIVPVPLFIKYPGQQQGKLVRGTADGRDIAPTVMAQLGLDRLENMTGRDLTGRNRLPQKQTADVVSTLDGAIEMDLAAIRRDRVRASRYMQDLFGDSFYATGGHANLLGKRPAGLTEIPANPSDPTLYEDVDTSSDVLPAYFQAEVSPPGGKDPGPLAIALNGQIVATSRAWQAWGPWYTGSLLPARAFRDGANQIRVYRIGSGR